MLDLIYCAGGNARYAEIAIAAGFRYGAQLPNYKTYSAVWFADQDWKHPDRAAYIAALARHRPHMATVLDLERAEQLEEVLEWAEDAAPHVDQVLIIPKAQGCIERLPRQIGGRPIVLAFSIPTRFGGTEIPLWEFAGWPIHLLGGSPQSQIRYALHLGAIARVISADGNMANKMSHYCRFWSARPGKKGHWIQLREAGLGDIGRGANAEAFRLSCEHIIAAWRLVEL